MLRPAGMALMMSLVLPASGASAIESPAHPLDPLDAQEITAAADVLKGFEHFPKSALFSTITLREPTKPEVLGFSTGSAFRREAFAIVLDQDGGKTFEAVVDLSTR